LKNGFEKSKHLISVYHDFEFRKHSIGHGSVQGQGTPNLATIRVEILEQIQHLIKTHQIKRNTQKHMFPKQVLIKTNRRIRNNDMYKATQYITMVAMLSTSCRWAVTGVPAGCGGNMLDKQEATTCVQSGRPPGLSVNQVDQT
jgi:hypothetical protein